MSSTTTPLSSPQASPTPPPSRRHSWVTQFTSRKAEYVEQRDSAWAEKMDRLLALVDMDTQDARQPDQATKPSGSCPLSPALRL